MSYEEYRAEALTKLGADFELEDLRNEERWRLKVLEALDNYSGGGSSDFSTAEVTVINQTELPVALETVLLIDDDEKYLDVSTNIFGGQTKETEVILYNGHSADSTNINSNQVPINIAVTGDIEIVEATALSITGAGTITITADSES